MTPMHDPHDTLPIFVYAPSPRAFQVARSFLADDALVVHLTTIQQLDGCDPQHTKIVNYEGTIPYPLWVALVQRGFRITIWFPRPITDGSEP